MQDKEKSFKTALKVNPGIDQPSSINPVAISKYKNRKMNLLKTEDFFKGIRAGNKTILSKAITLIESSLPEHQLLAQELISLCLPYSGNSIRIGITGVPGVGKSTMIEALGKYITAKGRHLAVLAIDPSSRRSKGSILGDKTRMEELAIDNNAYIRPSPSAGSLGGVARKTRETIILCEAAGFNTVFIETVGVGQSETAVATMVDFFLLLMLPGAGDELQGIKRGIMEMADGIFVNKCDGDNIDAALRAARELKNALQLYPLNESGWHPVVDICSSLTKTGIDKVWDVVQRYYEQTTENGFFVSNRKQQSICIMHDSILESLKNNFYQTKEVKKAIRSYEEKIVKNEISPYIAAQDLLKTYFKT
jgi:LAO/AO transport system kinase